jgi:hypothetical protein
MNDSHLEKKEDVQHVEHANNHLEAVDSLEKGNPEYVIDPVLEKQTMYVLLSSLTVARRSARAR